MKYSWVIVCLFLTSCASRYNPYKNLNEELKNRNFSQISLDIERARETGYYKEKDKVLYYLDAGFNQYYLQEFLKVTSTLSDAEYSIEDLYTSSIKKNIGSWLLNDTILDYKGEDYEDIFSNIFKSFAYIQLKDTEGALIEIRRVHNKLNLLEDKYATDIIDYNKAYSDEDNEDVQFTLEKKENRFYNDALSRYLGSILYRSIGEDDNARIERDYIVSAFNNQSQLYPFAMPTLPALSLPKNPENTYLNIIAMAGLAPQKESLRLTATYTNNFFSFRAKGYNSSQLFLLIGLTGLPLFSLGSPETLGLISFELPFLRTQPEQISKITVHIDGKNYGTLEKIETLNTIAQELYKNRLPPVVAKTLTRTIAKRIAKNAAFSRADSSRGGVLLASFLTDVALAASEQADLRNSHLLPANFYTIEVEVPKGSHNIRIDYYDLFNRLLYTKTYTDYLVQNNLNLLTPHFIE